MHVTGQTNKSTFTAETQMSLRPCFGQQTEIVWDITAVLHGTLADIPLPLTKTAVLVTINQFFRAIRTELNASTATPTAD